jgi:tellurite resistance protein TehA-like permease
VLFAFLLVLPFQARFEELTRWQEAIYYSALLCSTIAIILLIAPTAAHRIRWRKQDKEALLRMSTRAAIAATVFMAAAMTASVYLITDFLFGKPATVIVGSLVAAAFVVFWYGIPLYRRAKDQ